MKYRREKSSKFRHIEKELRLKLLTDNEKQELKDKEGCGLLALSKNVYHVEFMCLNKIYKGYGIKNDNGGIEFIDMNDIKEPITIQNHGYIVVSDKKNGNKKKCCLFFSFPDYLAFLSLREHHLLRLPDECDYYIMSSEKNYIPVVIETDEYEKIYTFFPNNIFGRTIGKTIYERNKKHVIEMNIIYKGNESLHDFVKEYIKSIK